MFLNRTIRNGVMKVIEEKILQAQTAYVDEKKFLEAEHEASIESLEQQHEVNKSYLITKHVMSVIGKLI